MTAAETKQASLGEWQSIAPEIRPSINKNPDGSMKPFFLKRFFVCSDDDTFSLEVINSADAYGKVPLVKIYIRGHIKWQGDHPIAAGAQKVDFIADISYDVTPLHPGFADAMNQSAGTGFETWEVGAAQSVMGKAFAPFGLVSGQIFAEYDLIYMFNDMLFWGARNVDGRGFDKEENRPTNLQIPMVRKT